MHGGSDPMTCVQLGTGHFLSEKVWRLRNLSRAWIQVEPNTPFLQRCIPDLRPAALRVGSDSLYIELGWMSGSRGQEECVILLSLRTSFFQPGRGNVFWGSEN